MSGFGNARRLLETAMSEFEELERRYSSPSSLVPGSSSSAPTLPTSSPTASHHRMQQSQLGASSALAAEHRRLFGSNRSSRPTDSGPSRRAFSSFGSQRLHSHPYRRNAPAQQVFTITAVCLSNCGQETAPSAEEKMTLNSAMLGEKRLSLGLENDAFLVHDVLIRHFPMLQETGYEMMRISSHRKLTSLRVPNDCLSAGNIRSALGQAKLYLRPLKKSLPLVPSSVQVLSVTVTVT